MKSIDPAELSGLLDGELTPEREAEIRKALAAEAGLAEEYEKLRAFDRDVRACAKTAEFAPLKSGASSWAAVAATLAAGAALRTLNLASGAAGILILVNGAALAVIIGWVLYNEAGRQRSLPTRG